MRVPRRTRMFPWQRSLRARLTVLFAALGLIPAVVVGYSVLHNLTRSIDVWENPGVTRTMESVRMVARTSVHKLVSNLAVHARLFLTGENRSADLAAGGPPAEAMLEDLQQDTEIDLVALLVRDTEGQWREVATRCADPVTFTSEEIELALHLTSLQTNEFGYLVSVFPFEDRGVSHALVLGYRLGPEYLPYLESIAAGLTYYSQLRLAKQVTRQSAILTAVTVALFILGLALFLGRKVARGVSRPVDNLVAGMQALGRGDRAQVRVTRGTDELRFLGHTFNRMSRELETTRRELARTERLAAWQEMARRIAHEIRNPLTPIQFALHRLQRRATRGEQPAPQEILDSVGAVLEELEGLKTLAGTFSEFARLPDPEPRPMSVNALLGSVAELFDDSEVDLAREFNDSLPEVMADRKGLRRVFTNLIKNAVETGAGRITIRTVPITGDQVPVIPDERTRLGPGGQRALLAEPHVRVTVEDDGPGVGPEALDRIFMPDYSTKPQGSGLGLAIVSRIVAQHGGVLVVDPREAGGVAMHVHLPLAPRETSA